MSDIKELESHLITTMMTLKGPRIDNDIHVSNLIDFCPRAYCISQEVGGYYNKDNAAINPSISMAFLIGDAIHDIMRDIFERAGILIKNEFPMERMYKGRVNITGRCDDIIKVGAKDHIVDIKSISTNNYNKLGICVDATHKQQVQAYMWLADKM